MATMATEATTSRRPSEISKKLPCPAPPASLADQKLQSDTLAVTGKHGRQLNGAVYEPVKKHGLGAVCALEIGDATR